MNTGILLTANEIYFAWVVFTISIKDLLAGRLQVGWSAQGPVRAGVA
jgi:hypothetical protein